MQEARHLRPLTNKENKNLAKLHLQTMILIYFVWTSTDYKINNWTDQQTKWPTLTNVTLTWPVNELLSVHHMYSVVSSTWYTSTKTPHRHMRKLVSGKQKWRSVIARQLYNGGSICSSKCIKDSSVCSRLLLAHLHRSIQHKSISINKQTVDRYQIPWTMSLTHNIKLTNGQYKYVCSIYTALVYIH